MEIREQVFVSSTYLDLVEEREVVIQGLLEAECFPAGMEMFPASNEDKWDLIKGVIDDSDYYLLIIGGRYGSVDPQDQMSYTEKEYEYASKTGKPIIAFLHRNPLALPRNTADPHPDLQAKLNIFRARVEEEKTVKYWDTAAELAGQVAQALMNLRRKFPAIGWVRGDNALTPETQTEIANLRARIAELESQESGKPLFPDLADGDEMTDFSLKVRYWNSGWTTESWDAQASWYDFFINVAPSLLHECAESDLNSKIESVAIACGRSEGPKLPTSASRVDYFVTTPIEDTVRVQFFALGLIERGTKKRVPSDSGNYWKLTQNGEDRLMSLRAIRSTDRDER